MACPARGDETLVTTYGGEDGDTVYLLFSPQPSPGFHARLFKVCSCSVVRS